MYPYLPYVVRGTLRGPEGQGSPAGLVCLAPNFHLTGSPEPTRPIVANKPPKYFPPHPSEVHKTTETVSRVTANENTIQAIMSKEAEGLEALDKLSLQVKYLMAEVPRLDPVRAERIWKEMVQSHKAHRNGNTD
ncbi:hypothetical protein C8034_v010427 [Colletotrichum sidae]|uniref:Uncharacterized protein n=1 Tax=Colletotrichum sidae TaxID=1347389 RepID=A0A4V3I1S1_9PEZI|nr:hypothetical protein C8034_v010427 [Colletotrichum sidae]